MQHVVVCFLQPACVVVYAGRQPTTRHLLSPPASIMAAIDKKVIDDRLMYRESVVTASVSIHKIAAKLNHFVTSLSKGEETATTEAYNALMRDMRLMRLEMCKAAAIYQQEPKEGEEYDRYQEEIAVETTKTESEILRLKGELEKFKRIRLQLEQYECWGVTINQYPAAFHSRRAATELTADIHRMQEEKERLQKAVERRHNQLSFIVQAVADLKTGLEADEAVDREGEAFRQAQEEGRGVENDADDQSVGDEMQVD